LHFIAKHDSLEDPEKELSLDVIVCVTGRRHKEKSGQRATDCKQRLIDGFSTVRCIPDIPPEYLTEMVR
jgi:hypothetical protein